MALDVVIATVLPGGLVVLSAPPLGHPASGGRRFVHAGGTRPRNLQRRTR